MMRRFIFLSVPATRRLAPAAAGLALVAAVVPAGQASAAPAGCTTSASQVTCVFLETGGPQTWTVPAGVTQATFTLYGAEGGAPLFGGGAGGLGAEVTGTLPVTPETVLQVNAGQAGSNEGPTFGGGGISRGIGGAGGGASDVRTPAADGSYPLEDRLLVAGGGGGGGRVGESVTPPTPAGGQGGNAGSAGTAGGSVSDFGTTLGGGGGGGAATGTGLGAGGAGGVPDDRFALTCESRVSLNEGDPGRTGSVLPDLFGIPSELGGQGGQIVAGGGGGGGGYLPGGGGGGSAGDANCGNVAGGGGGGGGSSYVGTSGSVTDGVTAPDDGPNGEVIITYAVPVTVTSVASSANPSVVGQQVTYTATVSPVPDGGTVAFTDGATTIAGCGSVAVSSTGTATCPVTYTSPGVHSITAGYSGDASFGASTSAALTQTVSKIVTSTTVASSANPSTVGTQVTYTATVSPPPDGGTVAFTDGGTAITGCSAQPVNTGTGQATCTTTPATAGAHNIVAVFSGTGTYAGSTSAAATQVVTSMSCASLAGCNLSGANLAGAQLAGANLTGANLSGATLTGANLAGANLSGVNLNKANLTGVNLKGATVNAATNFNKVTWSNTTCPDGTNSNADGGTCTGHLS